MKPPEAKLQDLEPARVWSHFATLCAIPRPSRQEEALRSHLIGWAETLGIEHVVDGVGNLILRKPASTGCESRPGVILQGHLDMVCQANAGTDHVFGRDPIRTVVRDGWVLAEETTLGADNGIGVALALAALGTPGLVHPALEVLLTVNEESGMDGAHGLAPGTLRGKTLINLDTEEWGHFYLGCAGGLDVDVRGDVMRETLGPGYTPVRIGVAGLCGGHSGIDIHLGRGNAIKLLTEALRELAGQYDLKLFTLSGGTARNAIPREAAALVAVPIGQTMQLAAWAAQMQADWRKRFAEADPNVTLTVSPADAEETRPLANADRDRLLDFLDRAPNAVAGMSHDFPGVVETSDNLGIVTLDTGGFHATLLVRSLRDEAIGTLADSIVDLTHGYGLEASKSGAYPGWAPNPASQLLALCQRVYAGRFGAPASLQVIHAGLECGLLAASHPGLDMISFGPDIRGAHAPGERVEIASVGRCWTLLKAVLEALAA